MVTIQRPGNSHPSSRLSLLLAGVLLYLGLIALSSTLFHPSSLDAAGPTDAQQWQISMYPPCCIHPVFFNPCL